MELVSFVGAILLTRMEAPPMVSNSELDCIREIIDLLSPFEKLTKEFLGVHEVVENVEPKNGKIQELKVELLLILAISTIIDPKFKFMHFKNAMIKSKVISYINKYVQEYNNIASNTPGNDTSDETDKDYSVFDTWKYQKQLNQQNMKNKSSATTTPDYLS